jgi:transcriptional regulator with XRE-family HTH domain
LAAIQLNFDETCGIVLKMAKNGKIKSLRLQQGLSQNGLARKADLDRATVASAERGRNVSDLSMSKIATALGVDVEQIDERTLG